MKECTRNIAVVINISRKLLFCADRGDLQRTDDSCGVLFGTTRDCAYKMLDLALKEKERHMVRGSWDKRIEEDVCGSDSVA